LIVGWYFAQVFEFFQSGQQIFWPIQIGLLMPGKMLTGNGKKKKVKAIQSFEKEWKC